jgi:hypothetical protein
MHELSMRDIGIGAKNKTFQLLFKGLKLSKFFIFGPLNKTHNTFLAHELKMRFKLLNFARKLFLMLLKKYTPPPPCSGKFIFTKNFRPNNLYLSKIS